MLYEEKMKDEIISKYTIPQKPGKDGYYRVWVADETKATGRRQITARNLDALKDKLYAFEKGCLNSGRKTFKDVFEINQKLKLEFVKRRSDIESTKSTIKRNQADFKRFIQGTRLENMFIDEISKKDLENVLLLNCKRYEMIRSSFNALRTVLSSTMKFAYQEELIDNNPYDRLDFKRYERLYDDGATTSERVFDDIQTKKILKALEHIHETRPQQMTAWTVHLEMLVNFRPGEAPVLLWEDIHDNFFGVCKEQIKTVDGEHLSVDHTKTRYNRRVPLTPKVKELLERIKAVQDVYFPDTEFLFPNATGDGCVKKKAVYDVFRRVCKKCGIELDTTARKGTSAFRKACSTKVQTATNPDFESKIFGHSPEVARKHYLADDGIDMNEAVRILDALGF